jgi:hypothetical protein
MTASLGVLPARLAAAALAVGLATCAPPPPPSGEARADLARQSACRARADQVYVEQNRGAIYLDEGAQQSYSPFSGTYVEGNPSRGLPSAYAQQEMVSDCVRNSDDAAGAAPAVPGTTTTPTSGAAGPGPSSR